MSNELPTELNPSEYNSNPNFNTTKYELMKLIGFTNHSSCYDNFNCDTPEKALILHNTFGSFCFIFCIIGLFTNPICLPAFNLSENRSGATFYLTIISICDLFYVFIVMLIFVVQYMPSTYEEQMEIYGTFTSKLIPSCLPLISFFEAFTIWLILALLMDRLLYMKLGFKSKTMTSRALSIKVTSFILIFLVIYTIPKYFQYYLKNYENLGLSRVVLTDIGQNRNYNNMITYWFKVPIEMFLPYLGVAVFNSMLIIMMVKVHVSKWLAVFNLSCDCVNDCCNKCTHCCGSLNSEVGRRDSHETSPDNLNNRSHRLVLIQSPQLEAFSLSGDENSTNFPPAILIDYGTMQSFGPSHTSNDELRENANVLISVIIGFTLLALKIPKFILHILSMEQYVVYDFRSYEVTNYFLEVLFAAIKPMICFGVGAHFRNALKVACGCSKINKKNPSISSIHTNGRTQLRSLGDQDSDDLSVHNAPLISETAAAKVTSSQIDF